MDTLRNIISLVLIGECREQMPVRNALQMHVVIVDAVCLVSLLGNNVIKKCVHSHISTPPNKLHQTRRDRVDVLNFMWCVCAVESMHRERSCNALSIHVAMKGTVL